jgi:hypothetical protein
MRKKVLQRRREMSLPGNAEMTWVFSVEENKYPWTWKTVFFAGRVFLD